MAEEVRDSSANENDLIVMAVKVIGRGERREVFRAIYHGKKTSKTASEIAEATGLTQKRVTEHGKRLARRHIVKPLKSPTAYEKVEVYTDLKDKILKLTDDPKTLAELPTKVSPRLNSKLPKFVTIRLRSKAAKATQITIDEVENFARVRNVKPGPSLPDTVSEDEFKKGVQAILGEAGDFKDWGGENSDLFGMNLKIAGKRRSTAFAFKGPGLRAKLVPGKMGKNGDQIQRMFEQDARVFFAQHWREIDPSVLKEMRAHAIMKSNQHGGEMIYYGIISGQDSERLRQAYPRMFGL